MPGFVTGFQPRCGFPRHQEVSQAFGQGVGSQGMHAEPQENKAVPRAVPFEATVILGATWGGERTLTRSGTPPATSGAGVLKCGHAGSRRAGQEPRPGDIPETPWGHWNCFPHSGELPCAPCSEDLAPRAARCDLCPPELSSRARSGPTPASSQSLRWALFLPPSPARVLFNNEPGTIAEFLRTSSSSWGSLCGPSSTSSGHTTT